MANHYDIPKWAGKPPVGFHLDVSKGDKLIQKLMIDEKKCYLFGRNPQLNDFCLDHGSCSRVHSVLVYHKTLQRAFLVDLGSTHGTHLGMMRLEANKPTQVPLNSTFHFGASTRLYSLRERPHTAPKPVMEELERMTSQDGDGALLGLPETETELDNLTEFNTAHNRRVSMLGIEEEDVTARRRRHKYNVSFKDDEDIINPEDVDPSIGRFRNLLQTTVLLLPNKRRRLDAPSVTSENAGTIKMPRESRHLHSSGLYADLPPDGGDGPPHAPHVSSFLFSSKLGLPMPNPAPDVELQTPEPTVPAEEPAVPAVAVHVAGPADPNEPKKKKYAKEAWPGKKPTPALLL